MQLLLLRPLIHFYGMHAHHGYPRWGEVANAQGKEAAIENIERAMALDISIQQHHRFLPYIQLYEFEGLLFSNIEVFNNGFEENEFLDYNYLAETIANNQNPEMINDGSETAPSKRLIKIIRGYKKVLHGALLAHDIGLATIRNKCPRFNQWIERLGTI